jgi:alpha-D-ribose 1-methylphosphonate 5-triphosphate synthase subunit PhnG
MSARTQASTQSVSLQQRWMAALAHAGSGLLEDGWDSLDPKPIYRLLRPVEIGMTLLRGRIGGTGQAFNCGEATVTRAAVALESGERGFAYLLGRRPYEAELAAVFHALLQVPARRVAIEELVVRPAEAARRATVACERAAAAATRVDFSTLARGDG